MSAALASQKASRAKKCPEKFYTCSISYKNLKFEIWNQLDHKYRSWRLFFLEGGGSVYAKRPPRPPRMRSRGSPARKISKGGGSAQMLSLRGGGVRPPRTPLPTSMLDSFDLLYLPEPIKGAPSIQKYFFALHIGAFCQNCV